MTTKWIALAALLMVAAGTSRATTAPRREDIAETVLVTYRPKIGAEEQLARAIEEHWKTVRRLDLVNPEPHVTLETLDEGRKPCFIDIFTWRDEDLPDNAPPELQKIWSEMAGLTEPRGGHGGIEITRAKLATGSQ